MRQRANVRLGELTAEQFNRTYPVGTVVRYWPGIKYGGSGAVARTRTPAWLVGATPCVSVEGYPGGIALTHVDIEPVEPETHDSGEER